MNDLTLTPGGAGDQRLNILQSNPIMTGAFATATDTANLKLGIITDSEPHPFINGCGKPGSIPCNPGTLNGARQDLYGVAWLRHQGNANPLNDNSQGETQGVRARVWRMGGVLLLALLLALAFAAVYAASAGADSLRVSCDVYATNQVDPIAGTAHDHRQFGNTGTTNESEWSSLRANKSTSCPNAPYLTSAAWYPVEQNEPNSTTILYYRAPGENAKVHALPEGIELIARQPGLSYSCGDKPGDPAKKQSTPPYGCTQNWGTHLRFPACWDGKGLKPENTVYGPTRTSCPDSHPHRLVETNFLVRHTNLDGVVPNPLRVSVGNGEWGDWSSMHADYFFAAQDEVYRNNVDLDGDGKIEQYDNDGDGKYEPWDADGDSEKNLVDLCVLDAPETLEFANARCRADGLLSAHVGALHSYYEGKPVPASKPATYANPPSAPEPHPAPAVPAASGGYVLDVLRNWLGFFGFGTEHEHARGEGA